MTSAASSPPPGFDEALREQHLLLEARLASGMPRAGWKICVNDRRLQEKLGLVGPFVGFLDGSRRLDSGQIWQLAVGSIPGVEPEFAVGFAASVKPGFSREAIRAAIRGVAPAIEVLEWRGATPDLAALASSSSFHAGFVVGALRPLEAVPVLSADCPRSRRGGEALGPGDPRLVPADLLQLVGDVADFLGRYGQAIEAGDWLLCGACTTPARVVAGDEVEADFGSLGCVRVRFQG